MPTAMAWILGLTALLFAAWAAPASAHPHVFIEAKATLQFKDGKLVAVAEEWLFDDVFSDQLMQEFDHGHKHRFDAADVAKLKTDAFAYLVHSGYFTHVRLGKREVPVKSVEGFAPEIRGKQVVYRFTAHFAEPLDPKATLKVGLYDDSYFVDVSMAKGASVTLDQAPDGCTTKTIDDKETPIYFGSVFPTVIIVSCASS